MKESVIEASRETGQLNLNLVFSTGRNIQNYGASRGSQLSQSIRGHSQLLPRFKSTNIKQFNNLCQPFTNMQLLRFSVFLYLGPAVGNSVFLCHEEAHSFLCITAPFDHCKAFTKGIILYPYIALLTILKSSFRCKGSRWSWGM